MMFIECITFATILCYVMRPNILSWAWYIKVAFANTMRFGVFIDENQLLFVESAVRFVKFCRV